MEGVEERVMEVEERVMEVEERVMEVEEMRLSPVSSGGEEGEVGGGEVVRLTELHLLGVGLWRSLLSTAYSP